MANFCVRYGNLVFVMANSKNVVFFMVKNRCVCYGCVRYDGTPSTTSKMFENPTNMSHYFFIHILMQLFERKIKCLPPRKMRLFDRFCNTASKRKKLQLPSSDHNDFLFRLSKQGDADGRTVTILYQCAMTVKYIFHFLSAP